MRRLIVVLGAGALVLVAACSGGGSGEGGDAAPSPSRSPTTTATTTPSSAPGSADSTPSTIPPEPLEIPSGPAYPLDFPDPFVLWAADRYHAMSTSSGLVQVPHIYGPDVISWNGPADILAETPTWADPLSVWAPALLRVDGTYVLWFTAQVRGTGRHCISFAATEHVDGPFVDEHEGPPLCPEQLGGAIDPSPFVDADGSIWLLWKNDGVTLRRESSIWSQRLDTDGRTLDGDATELIRTDQAWEFPHVEAPSMVQLGDAYWLAYSGNWWNQPAYGVGLARCESPAGPCSKPYDRAVIESGPGRYGPGGAEFFRDATGRPLLAYHAWLEEPGYPGHRALFVADPVALLTPMSCSSRFLC